LEKVSVGLYVEKLLTRYVEKLLTRYIIAGRWAQEEDEFLLQLVGEHGTNWTHIAQRWEASTHARCVRTCKQIRDRWSKILDPSLKRGPFTEQEDQQILELHQDYGNSWSRIAEHLPGRIGENIKTRYKSLARGKGPSVMIGELGSLRRANSVQEREIVGLKEELLREPSKKQKSAAQTMPQLSPQASKRQRPCLVAQDQNPDDVELLDIDNILRSAELKGSICGPMDADEQFHSMFHSPKHGEEMRGSAAGGSADSADSGAGGAYGVCGSGARSGGSSSSSSKEALGEFVKSSEEALGAFIQELFTQEMAVPSSPLAQGSLFCFRQQVNPAKIASYVEAHKV
jgi:hypothetical protein